MSRRRLRRIRRRALISVLQTCGYLPEMRRMQGRPAGIEWPLYARQATVRGERAFRGREHMLPESLG